MLGYLEKARQRRHCARSDDVEVAANAFDLFGRDSRL
jgi:hypothetical protein